MRTTYGAAVITRALQCFLRARSAMSGKRKTPVEGAAAAVGSGEEDEAPPPVKKARGGSSAKEGKPAATEGGGSGVKKCAAGSRKAKPVTDWASVKWGELGATKDGRDWNLKLCTWNVNGIRAWLKNGGLEYLTHESPDVLCLQETKCAEDDLPTTQLEVPGYHTCWFSAEQKGYSGVGLFSKTKPLTVSKGLGIEKFDCEGRIITAEYERFYLLTSYVPNAGEGLKRLDYKLSWDKELLEYMKKLDATKPVVLCGDLNVAHLEIDLAHPKNNAGTAGFTPDERADFSKLLEQGFVDVYRQLYPDKKEAYTYWSYRFNCRAKNVGWRLDYFVVSERLLKDVCDCVIRREVLGSDHCPLVLSLSSSS